MPPTMQSLGIDKLSVEERLALVMEIWDSIAAKAPAPTLTDAQRVELQRRVEEADARSNDGIPWEQVKADALTRLQR